MDFHDPDERSVLESECGLSRMHNCIARIKSFPVSVRIIATLSGLQDSEVEKAIKGTMTMTGLYIEDGKIFYDGGVKDEAI